MAVSSVHIELDRFFFATKDVTQENCWEWFKSFRDTLLYKEYEKNPNQYALELLDETDSYSAYCAVMNIEGRVVAELERKGEEVTFEKVHEICVQKKGMDYLELKEREAKYIELHPTASRWDGNERKGAKKRKAEQSSNNKNTKPASDKKPEPKPQNQQPPKPTTQKEPKQGQNVYGRFENVFLTQDEYSELARMIGNINELNNLIDSFGANLEDGSKTSNNHFATLIKWIDYRKSKAKEDEISGTRYESVTEHNRRVSEKADREIRQMKEMGLI